MRLLSVGGLAAPSDLEPLRRLALPLPRLQELELDGNLGLGDGGAAHLAAAALPALTSLDLEDTGLTDEGVRALCGAAWVGGLEWLSIKGNGGLGDRAAAALAAAAWPSLQTLDLMGIEFGADGWAALSRASWVRQLTELGVLYQPASRLEAWAMPRLELLEMSVGSVGEAEGCLREASWLGGLGTLTVHVVVEGADERQEAAARLNSVLAIQRFTGRGGLFNLCFC